MLEVEFSSDIRATLVDSMASDTSVVRAARVSTAGECAQEDVSDKKVEGLINYLMRARHGSPFEHNAFTFRVEAPIFVMREMMRHRISSFNEESGRYRELKPKFYKPDWDRKLQQVGKPGAYEFVDGTDAQKSTVHDSYIAACTEAYTQYEQMLEAGVAREVARGVLPVTLFSTCYMTVNARSMMNFLSLRRKVEGSAYPSFPQREIELVAEDIEVEFERLMPVTHAAFVKYGRVSP